MSVLSFTSPYSPPAAFFTGTANSPLVPSVFPVAIDGRPYMVDQKSGQFQRGYEQRVRDSQDVSTAPGEAAINPGGLWRRGQDSWHLGAGQQYADAAGALDYRFYKSKGINPWAKGQLSLLNATKVSLSNSATTQRMVVQDGRVYVGLDEAVKFSTDPFASSPTWTDCTGEPGGGKKLVAMATDGDRIYFGFENDGVRKLDPATSTTVIDNTKFINTTDNYYMLGFAKGFMFGAHDHKLKNISASGTPSDVVTPIDTAWRWVGVGTGQNAVYAAGYASKKSMVYKVTIKSDGTLDTGVVALELPTGETAASISGYLGFILLGTNKGVRFCTTDSASNLIAGPLIPTSSSVQKFSSNDRFAYFTWTNYDGTSGGLGRMDLSVYTATNAPAYATDLMYDSTADVTNVVIFDDKPVFMVSGVGVVVEDTSQKVSSGTIETGIWRWGIPDRKFVAKIDTRAEPLKGSITSYISTDSSDYESVGTWNTTDDIENTFDGTDTKAIEASFKFKLDRGSTVTDSPVFTRWMARAYATPFRSQVFVVPILLHKKVSIRNREYFFDVAEEQDRFDDLIAQPRVVTLQIGRRSHTVVVEDVAFNPVDAVGNAWDFEGTLTVTMRSVEN